MLSVLSIAFAMAAANSSVTAPAQPSIEFCQKSFAHTLDYNTNVFQQMFDDEDRAGLTGTNKQTQTGICLIYFKGMMDYVAATGPKT